MSARVLIAYAASTGFTSRQAAAVGSEIAAVSGLEVDVQPIGHVAGLGPYRAVFLGWSGHSRAGRRETTRFLNRFAALLPHRRVWVVHHQPGEHGGGPGRGPLRLSRLLIRHGVAPLPYDDAASTCPIPLLVGPAAPEQPPPVPIPA